MKVLNDELTVKTTTAQLNEDTAVDSGSDRKGTVAFHTFNGEDIEITNDYLVPFNAIDNVKVVHAKSESEVEDETCQSGEPPVPPTPKPTINGADDVTIAEGTSFDPMAGVSATDYEGNPLEVTVSGTVDVNVPAVYTLTYTATDSHGGTTTVRRKVTVIETDAPIINGANDVTINQGVGIDLADGVTATLDGEPIEFTYDPTELDKCEIGSHTVVYSATGNGKTTTVNRVVTITQVEAPTISGLDTLDVIRTETVDPLDGVSAVDANGNTVEAKVGMLAFDSNIDIETTPTPIGTTQVAVSDGDRVAVFLEGTATVNGETVTIPFSFSEANVYERGSDLIINAVVPSVDTGFIEIAVNNSDMTAYIGDYQGVFTGLNARIRIVRLVDRVRYGTVGNFSLYYFAQDDCGNLAYVPRTVNVTSQARIEGANNATSPQGIAFDLDDGVTAYDDFGDETTYTVSPSTFDECTVGQQTYTYTSTVGTVVERVITVTAISDPTISGLTALEVEVDEQFNPLEGVSAVDGNGNTITVTCDATNPMSYDTAGEYTITYTATDSCGNETTETRTVEVVAMATTLYTDGTFIINEPPIARATNIALHGAVVAEYEPLNANNPYVLANGNDQPWFTERNQIISVSFGSAVQPTSMGYWFQNCQNLESIDWTNFDGSVNTSLRALFAATKLTSFSGIPEMPNVETLRFMFNACESLTSCSMRGLNSSKVTDTNAMFQGCYALEEVTLAFGDSNVLVCGNMFSNYNNDGKGDMKIRTINNITTRKEGLPYDVPYFKNATTSNNMFRSCTSLVGGDGTTYDSTKIDKTYACCDLSDATGYFTAIV